MKAMILAAGLGTRLRPVTDTIPKALVEVEGKTLLQHSLEHLSHYGIRDVIINLHHFPRQIRDFLSAHKHFGLNISFSDESGELLETGGGIKKASGYFNDGAPFLVRNVDILSDLDLFCLAEAHKTSKSLATLAVRERETNRYFLFDNEMCLCGWENRSTGEYRLTRKQDRVTSLAFSGIQIISPAIFPLITETGRFSLTALYLRLSEQNRITGYRETFSSWHDAGKSLHF